MDLGDGFAQFYGRYPRKRERLEAEKAYGQIRRKGVEHERIMAGVERYLVNLPEETRFIPYPASWLRAGAFDDEYDEPLPAVREHWTAECERLHGGNCLNGWSHGIRMQDERREAS